MKALVRLNLSILIDVKKAFLKYLILKMYLYFSTYKNYSKDTKIGKWLLRKLFRVAVKFLREVKAKSPR